MRGVGRGAGGCEVCLPVKFPSVLWQGPDGMVHLKAALGLQESPETILQ